MASLLDIALSILLGMMLMLMILNYNNDMIETNFMNNLYYATQKNGYEFQEILQYEFRNIGLGVADPSTAIMIADSSRIKFKTDLRKFLNHLIADLGVQLLQNNFRVTVLIF